MCRRGISRSRRHMRQCGSTRKLRRHIRCTRRIRSNWRNRTGQYGQRGFHNRRPSRPSRYRCLSRCSLPSRRSLSRIRRNRQCRRSIRHIRSTVCRSRRTISTIPFTAQAIRASIRHRGRDTSNPRSSSIPPIRRLSPRQRRRRMPFSSRMPFSREFRLRRSCLRLERLRQCQSVQSQPARSYPVLLPCLPRRPCRLRRPHRLCRLRPSRRQLLSCSPC